MTTDWPQIALSSSTTNTFYAHNYYKSKNKSVTALTEPTSVSTEPSVPHAVLDFWCYSF